MLQSWASGKFVSSVHSWFPLAIRHVTKKEMQGIKWVQCWLLLSAYCYKIKAWMQCSKQLLSEINGIPSKQYVLSTCALLKERSPCGWIPSGCWALPRAPLCPFEAWACRPSKASPRAWSPAVLPARLPAPCSHSPPLPSPTTSPPTPSR